MSLAGDALSSLEVMRPMNTTIEMTAANDVISELLDAVDGELTARSRVVDGLLDLRNTAAADGEFQIRVDEILGGIPGLTTVPNGWWVDRLEELRSIG